MTDETAKTGNRRLPLNSGEDGGALPTSDAPGGVCRGGGLPGNAQSGNSQQGDNQPKPAKPFGAESKSYRDPLGERAFRAGAATRAYESQFPPVASVYDGFYLRFLPNDKAGNAYLAGSEGIIGSEFVWRVAKEGLQLLNHSGVVIGILADDRASQLLDCCAKNWRVRLVLAEVRYSQSLGRHAAEIACICYQPELAEALDNFVRNISYRIAKGQRPGLTLSQEQLIRVIQSKGAWYLTKNEKHLPCQEGEIIYKRRRSLGEGLIEQAYQGRRGCKFAALAFWLVLAVLVILIVIRLVA